jgi:HK97 family phage major capsid protein
MPAKDRNYYLALAETILSNQPYSKEQEARFRSACYLAQVAGGDTRKSEVPAGFVDWLRRGKESNWKPEKRASLGSDQGGGAYPGSTSGFFTPTEFSDVVWSALKAVDDLFDPAVVTILTSNGGGPQAVPLSDDTEGAAAKVDQNQQSTPISDIPISSLQFSTAPTWRSGGLKISVEQAQDVGIDLLAFLTSSFAVRFQRGFSPGLITQLLAVASVVRTSGGATASGQSMAGIGTSGATFGSDDLALTLAGLDAAYLQNASWLMNESTLGKTLALRSASTGGLIFGDTDENDDYVILGKPVKICPSMPSLGASNIPVLLGDLKRLCIRKVKGGDYIVRGGETFAENLQVWYENFVRADAGILWFASNPSTPSPFVALQCHS